MSTEQSFYDRKMNNPNKVVVTKLQGGFPVNAPLATQPQTTMSVQNNAIQQGGFPVNAPLATQPQNTMSVQNNAIQQGGISQWGGNSQPTGDEYECDEDDDEDCEDEDECDEDEDECDEDEDEDEDECDEDEEDCDQAGGASDADTASTVSTTKLFGRDPLYLVLSSFLSNEDGENIVDVLGKINRNLAKLVAVLDKDNKDNKSSKKNKADKKTKTKSKS
jgi:hypothetical protein